MTGKPRAAGTYRAITALACLLYFTSYITRLDYNAALADIVENTSLGKAEAGIASTALFFAYGVGQIASGILGDRLRPQRLILAGLLTTAACNLLLPFFDTVVPMSIVWAVNGLAQAMFWPPLLKILTRYVPKEKFASSCFLVITASQAATVLIYLLVPLVIVTLNWQSVFYVAAGFALVTTAVWCAGFAAVSRAGRGGMADAIAGAHGTAPETDAAADAAATETDAAPPVRLMSVLWSCGIAGIFIAIAAQGFLKDGITTWMPTYISETFGLETSMSILMNVVLPVVSILGIYLITTLYRRFCRNEVRVAAVCFALAAPLALVLYFFADYSAVLSLVLSALVVCLMHGVNLVLISYAPGRFARLGKVSTVSGITNAATYVGSGLSSYGMAAIAETLGWANTVLCWVFVAVFGAGAALLSVRPWKRFIRGRRSRQHER